MAKANEEWRHDPDRRHAATDLYLSWAQAVEEAEKHLAAAEAAFEGLPLPDREPSAVLTRRVLHGIRRVLRDDVPHAPHGAPSAIHVGNMAAFGIGYEEGGG